MMTTIITTMNLGSQIVNIKKADLVFARIKSMVKHHPMYWHIPHFKHHLNNSKSVLYTISLVASLPIILSKNAMTLKNNLLTSILITKNGQGIIES